MQGKLLSTRSYILNSLLTQLLKLLLINLHGKPLLRILTADGIIKTTEFSYATAS